MIATSCCAISRLLATTAATAWAGTILRSLKRQHGAAAGKHGPSGKDAEIFFDLLVELCKGCPLEHWPLAALWPVGFAWPGKTAQLAACSRCYVWCAQRGRISGFGMVCAAAACLTLHFTWQSLQTHKSNRIPEKSLSASGILRHGNLNIGDSGLGKIARSVPCAEHGAELPLPQCLNRGSIGDRVFALAKRARNDDARLASRVFL